VVTVVAIADPEAANAPIEVATVAAKHRTAAKLQRSGGVVG
jgi:hypothetical protein